MVSNADTKRAAIEAWLQAFAAAVRARDFAAGRALFDTEVVAFGTIERVCRGLDALDDGQWREVWPRTSGYEIRLIGHDSCGGRDGLAWAAVTWASLGHIDGRTVRRSGRATFVLRRRDGVWRAVHSHHSIDPGPAAARTERP